MPKKPRAYSYLRFSTPEQLKGDSLRRQTQLADEYARKHGLVLDTELNLRDLGVSAFRGANVSTGALGVFLKAIDEGIVDRGAFLLVESLDRVSRDTAYDAQLTLQNIINKGVTVVTLMDGRAYSREALTADPLGILYALMVFMRANEESRTKSRRIKAAWHGKRQRAKSTTLTAITPGWMQLDAQRRPVLIPERAAVVRKIVRDFLRGVGKHSIARDLNTSKVPPFGRAKHWQRSYIDKILTSPTLIGTFVPHIEEHKGGKLHRIPQEPVEGYYPAVIDAGTWERLQAVNRKSPLRGRHAGRALQNVLSGLARCPRCDSTMTRVSKGSRRRAGKPFLVCTRAKTGAGCEYRAVPCDAIEDALTKNYRAIVDDMPSPDAALDREWRSAEAAVSELEGRIGDLMAHLERRPSDALARRIAELEVSLMAAKKARDEVAARATGAESRVLKLKLDALGTAIRARPMNRERINAALRELLDKVVIDYRSGYLEFHWRAGGESSILYAWPKEGQARAR